ncbi:MAG: DUF2939 domain-containing protein [Chloracidobacterium sp.]|nr:DUF2939 domain-containing protein [Chloracidobacterium sp.]
MSKNDQSDLGLPANAVKAAQTSGSARPKRQRLKVVILTASLTVAVVAMLCGAAAFLYWQYLKTTPQYALASIVEAARADDRAKIEQLIDVDSVVDDFVPQVTGKAVELYGRGIDPEVVRRAAKIAEPVMPAIKERARAELPGAIRRQLTGFENFPFAALVIGADRYFDIGVEGETAVVKSKLPGHSFEVRMRREEGQWAIAAVRDDELARQIAERIGQEIMSIAVNGGGKGGGSLRSIKNLNEMLKEAEKLFE